MMPYLVALLALTVTSDGEPLRLVSTGTGDAPVHWLLDGETVAATHDGSPANIQLPPGTHTLYATSQAGSAWTVLVRPEPAGAGVVHAPAWTAAHAPEAPSRPWLPLLPGVLGAVAVLAGPLRSALEAWLSSSHRGD